MKKSRFTRQLTKRKPSVYLSSRPYLSPVLTDLAKSLSRNVILRGATSDDPESAYLKIHECDAFVFYLNHETIQQLFALYELGAAVVFEKPMIMIRDATVTFSQLRIPPHFYETDILVQRSESQLRRRMLTKRIKSLSLGDVLVYGYENAVKLSSGGLSTCADELFNRVLCRLRTNRAVDIPLRDLQISSIKPKPKKKSGTVKMTKTLRNYEHRSSKETSSLFLEKQSRITSVDSTPFLCTQTNYMSNSNEADEFPGKTDERPRKDDAKEESEQCLHTYDMVALNKRVSISTTTPLPSPIAPQNVYYPTALPINPMHLSFPPFKMEELEFNKHAIAIARSGRLPSLVRRRVIERKRS